ncbi:hypothetical protein AcW1_007236 [Taiwanofungus camphoratus]|nr:hypothetical protein AcW1_007236 [Antrodia cinnamomea]
MYCIQHDRVRRPGEHGALLHRRRARCAARHDRAGARRPGSRLWRRPRGARDTVPPDRLERPQALERDVCSDVEVLPDYQSMQGPEGAVSVQWAD